MNSKLPWLKQSVQGRRDYYGAYRARCLNNNDPVGLGRILVHIYIRDGNLTYDESTHQWIPVLSPFGGVKGMGFYMIPPIHALGDLLPVERRGHPGVGERAHRIRGTRRSILGVLVVVEEHAVALFFPPFRAG